MLSSFFARVSRSFLGACTLGLFLVATGCNETQQAADPAVQVTQPPLQKLPTNRPDGADAVSPPPAQQVTAKPPQQATPVASAQTPARSPQAMPNIPADAQFTIFCFAVNGANHVQDANGMRDALVRKTGRSDWYLIHGRDESNLYFGFYKAVQPGDSKLAAEVSRAQSDLKEIKEIRDAVQNKPFEHTSIFVPLESPDPTSPSEWNLYNVDKSMHPKDPKRGYWSLQVMAFRANPNRKEAAVEAVRTLRSHGVEAYYYHGESISCVTVGHWPADALKAQNRTDAHPDAPMADPNTNLAVSTINFGEEWRPNEIQGRKTVAAVANQEILDPSLKQMIQKFPHHAVNYEEGVQLPNGKIRYNSSFLVEIPRAKGNGPYDYVDPSAPPTARQQQRGIGDPNGPSMTGSSTGLVRPGSDGSLQGLR